MRADIAFRRSTSTYSMEESQIQVYFSGGCLNGTEYSTPSLVKAYARKAQFGQIFTFESQAKQEYGRNEKLGDKTSSTKTTL